MQKEYQRKEGIYTHQCSLQNLGQLVLMQNKMNSCHIILGHQSLCNLFFWTFLDATSRYIFSIKIFLKVEKEKNTYESFWLHQSWSKQKVRCFKFVLNFFRVFLHYIPFWDDGPNNTISHLFNLLWQDISECDIIPPILYINLDNCVKDNKNNYIFAFVSVLIEKKWFSVIYIAFLPVGHTHDEVDGMFGTIGERKKFLCIDSPVCICFELNLYLAGLRNFDQCCF